MDERTETDYRAFMHIDGANKSGSVEYFLYRKENGSWKPVSPDINGRLAPYQYEIEKLFGSIELFLRSAFVSQKQPKNLPDLSEATKGEKKALFRELGGLDYLQVYSDEAKEKEKSLDRELIGDRSTIESLKKDVTVMPEKRKELQQLDNEKAETEKRLKEIEKKGFKLKEQLEEFSQMVEKNRKLQTNIDNVSKEITDRMEEQNNLKKKTVEYQQAIQNKSDFEKRLQDLEDLKKQEAKLNEEKSKVLEQRERLIAQYQHDKDAVGDIEKKINTKTAEIQSKLASFQSERTYAKKRAEQLEEDLREPITENCPTCGQKWPAQRKAEFEQKRNEKETILNEFKQEIFEFDKKIISFKNQLKQIQVDIDALQWPQTPELPSFDETLLENIQQQLNLIDESFLRSELEKAKEAEVRIEESEKQIEILNKQIENRNEIKAELMHQIDEEADEAYREVSSEMEKTRSKYIEIDKELTRIATEINAMLKQMQDLAAKKADLNDLKETVQEKEKDLQEWQYLHKACGPDGIQALELDAMGPGIADVANSILESAYGSRFQIEFRTTRIGGSGAQKKQIEDFLIIIHDSQDGSEQLLETLSGGESIWVKRAIYDAFGIIRARKTGTKFLTVFQDEMDGALDPEARMNYFRMLERAHQESGRYHTIVITHNIDAQEMIEQKIEMRKYPK